MTPILKETSLELVRNFNASVADVYEAWTDPLKMKQWMGPRSVSCGQVEIDLQVGGKYRIDMNDDACEHHIAVGEYREIVPETKLVFTWTWEGSGMPKTQVTLLFESEAGGTRLTLRHEGFPEQEVTDKHLEGWQGCFEGLNTYCES